VADTAAARHLPTAEDQIPAEHIGGKVRPRATDPVAHLRGMIA